MSHGQDLMSCQHTWKQSFGGKIKCHLRFRLCERLCALQQLPSLPTISLREGKTFLVTLDNPKISSELNNLLTNAHLKNCEPSRSAKQAAESTPRAAARQRRLAPVVCASADRLMQVCASSHTNSLPKQELDE